MESKIDSEILEPELQDIEWKHDVYKYTCPDCGWEGYKGQRIEIVRAECAKCGSHNIPIEEKVEMTIKPDVANLKRLMDSHKGGEDSDLYVPLFTRAEQIKGLLTGVGVKVHGKVGKESKREKY